MLKTDAQSLLDEVEAAIADRRLHLTARAKMLEQYTTPWYRQAGDVDDESYNPENHSYEMVAHVLPQLAWKNPDTHVSSRRGDAVGSAMTASYDHGMRQWLVDTRYAEVVEPLAVDYLFPTGFVAMITKERNPTVYQDESWDEEPEWPQVARVSPDDYFVDPLGLSKQNVRYAGHRWHVDKDDLIERAKRENEENDEAWGKWDMEALEALVTATPDEDYGRTSRRAELLGAVERDTVCCYTVWIPEYTEDDWPGVDEGFHGGEFVLSANASGEGVMLREPRPYFGPRWGPYVGAATYPVPDSPHDLSVLVASEGQVRDFNRHALASSDSAARYKRLILVGPGVNDEAVDLIRNGEHDLVVKINDLPANAVMPVEIGGVTDQMLAYLALAKDRLDRSSGLSDAKRGAPTGSSTATEAAIADTASQVRMDYVKQVWYRANQRILTSVAWYMWHCRAMAWPISPEILETLGEDAVRRMTGLGLDEALQAVDAGVLSLTFRGGDGAAPKGGEAKRTGISFDDLQIEIEPYSMERVSEATLRQKGQALLELVAVLPGAMAQAPFVNWETALGMIGKNLGIRDLPEIFDLEAFGEWVGFQQQQQAAAAAPKGAQGPSAPSPRGQRGSPAQTRPQGPGTPWGGQNVRREAKAQAPADRGTKRTEAMTA